VEDGSIQSGLTSGMYSWMTIGQSADSSILD